MQKLMLPTPRLPLCVLCASSHGAKERKGGGRHTLEQFRLPAEGREEGCACVGKGRAGECSRVGRLDVPPRLRSVTRGGVEAHPDTEKGRITHLHLWQTHDGASRFQSVQTASATTHDCCIALYLLEEPVHLMAKLVVCQQEVGAAAPSCRLAACARLANSFQAELASLFHKGLSARSGPG
ncbi:hypothetical protein HPB48_013805 [Haemaphysalis longicornis]|uniref:Uncharacterized protein n=1 Tax=Haemaphysalis longicornis TaxID=44386 RepID=A0A9J6FC41_HAELO|nr:hypothetical protein HPB48_013805 [Haemaphysalis longicornis]